VLIITEESYKRVYVRNENNKYKEVALDNDEFNKDSLYGILGYLYPDRTLKIHLTQNQLKITKIPESKCMLIEKEFYIRDCIMNEAAYTACDRSKKDNLFGRYCVIIDLGRSQSLY